MSSEVYICNLALSNIGKTNINDLAEASAEARACNQFYAHTRDTLLQAYPWRKARKTQSLAEVANDKPGRWRYAYRIPNDCLKVLWISSEHETGGAPERAEFRAGDPRQGHPYEIEGQTLYCNLSPCYLTYTFRLTDPTKFTPLFIDALGWHLAVRLAMPLTRDPKVRADAFQLATQMQIAAEVADANEVRETSDHDSELIEARG